MKDKIKNIVAMSLLIMSAVAFWVSYPIAMTIGLLIMLMISFSGVIMEFFSKKKE